MRLTTGVLAPPAVVVHGGAGVFAGATMEGGRQAREGALDAALAAAWSVLSSGGSALTAAVEAVASMEDSGAFNAGRGSSPTTAGVVEMDAAVMDGATRAGGAVCATTWPANAVRAALAVRDLYTADGWPLLLAGEGADALAREQGLAPMEGLVQPAAPSSDHGTVGAVAVDAEGHVAAGTSTGGRRGQRPGRVGDTSILGAGTWADDATAAVSATGIGEAFILSGFGHRLEWAMHAGADLEAAMRAGLEAVGGAGGNGGAIALTRAGQFVTGFTTPAIAHGWRDQAQSKSSIEFVSWPRRRA